jgi:hypothetical protein
MDKAAEVLVIIVSGALSIFLLVGIIAGIKVVQLISSLKRIANKAESIADSAEVVGDFFRKSAGPVAFTRFIANITETVIRHKKSNK